MSYKVLSNVLVPMRDGTKLATNIWLPESDGPLPVLLTRTSYDKDEFVTYTGPTPNIFKLVQRGYAVVVQDCRGTFASEGTFIPFMGEAEDGVDTIQWLLDQEWCDGNIGTFGGSYLGMVQWRTAATGVPGLKAMAPTVSSGDLYRTPWYSEGGALSLAITMVWATMMSLQNAQRGLKRGDGDLNEIMQLAAELEDHVGVSMITPLIDHPLVAKHFPWPLEVVLAHPDRDELWTGLAPLDNVSSISTPALHVGGWYDLFIGETLKSFTKLSAQAGSVEAREGQYLIIGPWAHSVNGHYAIYPDRGFGLSSSMEAAMLTDSHTAFFDRWLKGHRDALDDHARVRLFVMGIDQWRDESDWPLPDTEYTDYYLDGNGPANTAAGAGILTTVEPTSNVVDTYLYDPRRPVPTLGGTTVNPGGWDGAADQRPVHGRDDVLVFTTEVLDEPLEVTGPVTATLYVTSSAVDTDFTAKLVDVHPDGRAIILTDGIQRMRYRDSLSAPELMTPGEIYEITIDLMATSNVFLPGHRIMVEISSSNFPRYDRNSNTGGAIAQEHLSDMVTATNQIHRGAEYPSRIILPIINR
ncbi:CocE/NonD family hydrolase [Nocardia vinacea]|uniref:CocE/NonD family hydrolase n=1 Tax=Nocardia vinacea TaxID=96468 RepID=UPI00030B6030|nr:CocE/NonD family hydrolase [Nocardia vinacea]